jgi:hypothetical protein
MSIRSIRWSRVCSRVSATSLHWLQPSALATALLLVSAVAQAQVVFDNGAPTGSGIEVTIRVIADDFIVTVPATITRARFWASGINWDRKLDYYFFEHAGTVPAEVPWIQGQGVNATRELIEDSFDDYLYHFEFEEPIELEPFTRYWFGLHLKKDFADDFNNVFWAITEPGFDFTSTTAEDGDFSDWRLAPKTHAWQLLPEPGAALQAFSILVALAVLRRRRTQSRAGGSLHA